MQETHLKNDEENGPCKNVFPICRCFLIVRTFTSIVNVTLKKISALRFWFGLGISELKNLLALSSVFIFRIINDVIAGSDSFFPISNIEHRE